MIRKTTIAALAAGITIGATGTAGAASVLLFDKETTTYRCSGTATAALCDLKASGGYGVLVTRKTGVTITHNGRGVFSCMPRMYESECLDFRR